MKIFFIIVFILVVGLFAEETTDISVQDNNTSSKKAATLESALNKEPSIYEKLLSLDYIHRNVSKKILIFSSNLDHTVEEWVKDDENTSKEDVEKSIKEEEEAYSLFSIVNLYDNFFKDDTFLSTTNNSYIRIRWGAQLNQEEGFNFLNNIRVNLRLPKTEEALYLFIGDDEDDDTKTFNNTNEDKTTSVGVKYMLDNLDVLNGSIFGGFRGITNPFIKLRIQYPIAFKYLLFRPVQYVEYAYEDEFKEETQLYFDHRLESKKELVRLSLSRYTKTYLDGMHYSSQLSYLSTIKHGVGIQVYTGLQGQTQAQTTEPANTKYNITPTAGIYNYNTGIIWKQQFFKKYLFYELQPLVEFDQQYDYNANYIFRANLELYFGDI
ncbi:hypothetical protein [Sulfurimonas sp.]|uniref:hypothetical protein n=1 Tax=Sulfurimonas sp. TaxID=2022749 RepID=UPI00356A2939